MPRKDEENHIDYIRYEEVSLHVLYIMRSVYIINIGF